MATICLLWDTHVGGTSEKINFSATHHPHFLFLHSIMNDFRSSSDLPKNLLDKHQYYHKFTMAYGTTQTSVDLYRSSEAGLPHKSDGLPK